MTDSRVHQPAGPLGPNPCSTRFRICVTEASATVSPDLTPGPLARSPTDLPLVQHRPDDWHLIALEGAQENGSIRSHYSWMKRGV